MGSQCSVALIRKTENPTGLWDIAEYLHKCGKLVIPGSRSPYREGMIRTYKVNSNRNNTGMNRTCINVSNARVHILECMPILTEFRWGYSRIQNLARTSARQHSAGMDCQNERCKYSGLATLGCAFVCFTPSHVAGSTSGTLWFQCKMRTG